MQVYGGGNFDIGFSPANVLFNQVAITDINFFNFSQAAGNAISQGTPIYTIRQSIAVWYYSLRNLAVVILLCILVYVGIRMAISTVASEEAKYKKMLKDWVISIAVLFLLHYIIIITINLNNALVGLFDTGGEDYISATQTLLARSTNLTFTIGFGSAVVYAILVGVSLVFLILYIKRMLTIAFLTMIAPIITITYSIDKMGDRKVSSIKYMA